jgi:hypothetical protein
MPLGQRLSLRSQAIGAAFGQPIQRLHALAIQHHAIGHALLAVRIVDAQSVLSIEQGAGDVGRIDEAGLLIFQLVQAAAAAAVAQGFPLAAVQLRQRFFPEWGRRFVRGAITGSDMLCYRAHSRSRG